MIASTRRLALLLLPLLTSACAHTEPLGPLIAESLYADSHCGREESRPAAWWVPDDDAYRALSQRLRTPASRGRLLPPVDFRSYAVLLIEMGRQPTGGYSLRLAQPEIGEGEFGAVQVHVQWRTPGPGMITTQVITSPCLLVKMPKSDYQEVQIVDQMGQLRVSTTLQAVLPQLPGGFAPPKLPSMPSMPSLPTGR